MGIETPDDATLKQYHRAVIREDRQREFVALCRSLGIRTVGGFMIGFPHDTEDSIRRVWEYAMSVNPTYANFNVVTPYPGTQFYNDIKDQIADFDFTKYTVYTPVLKYKHLTPERIQQLLGKCFGRFYFRWDYLRYNAHLLWPGLQRFGIGRRFARLPPIDAPHEVPGAGGPEDSRSARGPACRRAPRAHFRPRPHGTQRGKLNIWSAATCRRFLMLLRNIGGRKRGLAPSPR